MFEHYCRVHYPHQLRTIKFYQETTFKYRFKVCLRRQKATFSRESDYYEPEENSESCICQKQYLEFSYRSLLPHWIWGTILGVIAISALALFFIGLSVERGDIAFGGIALGVLDFIFLVLFVTQALMSKPKMSIELSPRYLSVAWADKPGISGFSTTYDSFRDSWKSISVIRVQPTPTPRIRIERNPLYARGGDDQPQQCDIPLEYLPGWDPEALTKLMLQVQASSQSKLVKKFEARHGVKPLSWRQILDQLAQEKAGNNDYTPR
ncbi:hypothetical protein BSR28_05870 [Boudabousia liubingyangii]|uniref:hypothetical protein n=1 Tax=Boudabousia liubingyangii TaxID=1921764 RepID=UPI000938E4A8|nr:hypothetical protein [Boudabousia liubingyangii]OKL46947.1 hypothetical protein BSR28_05870 [Boudabousia liubingyangii]